jgi:hypothetical protein
VIWGIEADDVVLPEELADCPDTARMKKNWTRRNNIVRIERDWDLDRFCRGLGWVIFSRMERTSRIRGSRTDAEAY